MKYLIALAAMTAISGAAAFAGEKKDDMKCMDMGKHMEAKAEDHFKAVDADADGKVTEAELVEYVTAKAKKEFASMSGDDGVATLDELKAHHKAKHDGMMKEHAGMDHKKMDHGDHEAGRH